jgi:hypothetical protein
VDTDAERDADPPDGNADDDGYGNRHSARRWPHLRSQHRRALSGGDTYGTAGERRNAAPRGRAAFQGDGHADSEPGTDVTSSRMELLNLCEVMCGRDLQPRARSRVLRAVGHSGIIVSADTAKNGDAAYRSQSVNYFGFSLD